MTIELEPFSYHNYEPNLNLHRHSPKLT
uniref:Uncharacterized protein n=1 Tax=Lepeophtheirus salmonis TaxID=72036 RepID=A0A0K2U6W2_LEPSM